MSQVYLMIILGLIFIAGLLLVVVFMPGEKKGKRRKNKQPPLEPQISAPDLEAQKTIEKLQRHVQSLHHQIADFQKREKDMERRMAVEQLKVKKLEEKLSQEREWQAKDQTTLDKKGAEFQRLKDELSAVQENSSREHAENLRQKQDIQQFKREMETLQEYRRGVEAENMQLKAKIENQRREMVELKKDNAELKKKDEDTSWVAKSDYERLETLLREKDKQLQRFQRESEK